MQRLLTLSLLLTLAAGSALALSPGQEVIVPAAGRGAPWGTDLYIMNPGTSTVSVTVSWLVRGSSNTNPDSFTVSIMAGETAVLEDVIFNDFGFEQASGAFLIESDGGEVIANSRIFATEGDATFGQGFEGVPTWAATQEGQTTNVVGLSFTSSFRTNVYATAGADGASIDFSLLDPDGIEFATATLNLDEWEPYLRRVN